MYNYKYVVRDSDTWLRAEILDVDLTIFAI